MKRLTKVYKCEEAGCSKEFHYKEGLDGHLIVDHGKENLKWNCKICSASYIHKRHHDRHMREKHLLDKHGNPIKTGNHRVNKDNPKEANPACKTGQPEKSRCKICFAKFESRLELDSHLILEHQHEGKWECQECHSKFILRRHLHDHMMKIHQMDKDGTRVNLENGFYKCPNCSDEFPTKEKLDSHLVQDHGQERSHECDLCGIKEIIFNLYNEFSPINTLFFTSHVHQKPMMVIIDFIVINKLTFIHYTLDEFREHINF